MYTDPRLLKEVGDLAWIDCTSYQASPASPILSATRYQNTFYLALYPPSITNSDPVIKLDSSDARNNVA